MLNNKTGQMSIMLIVAIAIALVFLSVTMNWNRIIQVKTQSQVAATTTAAYLVSQMASYGQSKIETELGGKAKVCNYTGVLSALITLIVIIIVIVVSVFTVGTAGATTAWAGMTAFQATMLVASAVLAAATLVIQVTVIQPAITRMWNKMQQNIKTTEDRFMESALQTGLQGTVSDSESVPDYLDMDRDGRWNAPGELRTTDDTIPRFTYWYTLRLLKYAVSGSPLYDAFRASVEDMATKMGIESTDDNCCEPVVTGGPHRNFCNENCTIREKFDISGDPFSPPQTDTTILDGCDAVPYVGHPYSYDPLFCARKANKKLVGFLGRDDISKILQKTTTPHDPASTENIAGAVRFHGTDSEGPLFRTLWFMRDTSPRVDDIAPVVNTASRRCFWCDMDATGGAACQAPGTLGYFVDGSPSVVDISGASKQLNIPAGECIGNDCCVNHFLNKVVVAAGGIDPRIIDNVGAVKELVYGSEDPPPAGTCPGDPGTGEWRAGSDLFCSSNVDYPHYMYCPAHFGTCNSNPWSLPVADVTAEPSCVCSAAPGNKELWNDDNFDDTYVKLRETANNIQPIIKDTTASLASNLVDYETGVAETLLNMVTVGGRLRNWRDAMLNWRDGTGGYSYKQAAHWCLSPSPSPAEAAFIGAGEGVAQVIRCERFYETAGARFGGCLTAVDACPTALASFSACLSGCATARATCVSGCAPGPGNAACVAACMATETACLAGCPAIKAAATAAINASCSVTPRSLLPGFTAWAPLPVCDEIIGIPERLDYRAKIADSKILAARQDHKFAKRAAYLDELLQRVNGGGGWPSLIQGLTDYSNDLGTTGVGCDMGGTLEQRLQCFQGANSLAEIWTKFQAAKTESLTPPVSLGPSVIYGWKSAPAAGMDPTTAAEHVIRVDVALPKRCGWWESARGGIDKSCGTNKFPWVKTKKKGSFKRCYYITDTDGCVKVRISRYDSDSSNSGVNGFGGLAKMWKFLYRHPEHMADGAVSLGECWSLPAAFANLGPASPSPYLVPYSFMLDSPGVAATGQVEDCRQKALIVLKQGFFTEVCAKYFLVGNKYDIKFIPCRSANACMAL